jgi:hypothetical protein
MSDNSLSAEELDALRSLARNGLMRLVIPEHISEALVHAGYAQPRAGGIVATEKGKLVVQRR